MYISKAYFIAVCTLTKKRQNPNKNFFLLRGNHESAHLNMRAGFYRELSRKDDEVVLFGRFSEVFCWMPVAHLIEGRILVVHGGISGRKDFRVDDIRRIKLVFIHDSRNLLR